jgi:SPX domain protein involved in polyphosphate accumulation
MKFAKTLKEQSLELPEEWKENLINYKQLKKCITQISKGKPCFLLILNLVSHTNFFRYGKT